MLEAAFLDASCSLMDQPASLFPPTMAAARNRLADFAPYAAADYKRGRNFDPGPGLRASVSALSPYIRVRALDEIIVAREILRVHSQKHADAFLAELFWRTYWKGWMELRPAVWDQYQDDLGQLHDDIQTQTGLRKRWEAACLGQTGIAPFDAWAQELSASGHLHNHARMWFASIWIFTLGLPWQLGADFFLRHLLDGDVAVNTLSWRWVAGIQTPGKSYLAQAENIERFSHGRFAGVTGLAAQAEPIAAPPPPAPGALRACHSFAATSRTGLLVHGDDLNGLLLGVRYPRATACLLTEQASSPWLVAPAVGAFRSQLADDMAGETLPQIGLLTELQAWAKRHNLDQVITPYAPVGPIRDLFEKFRADPSAPRLIEMRRPLDSDAWPLATKGFYSFRKHIPDLLARHVFPPQGETERK